MGFCAWADGRSDAPTAAMTRANFFIESVVPLLSVAGQCLFRFKSIDILPFIKNVRTLNFPSLVYTANRDVASALLRPKNIRHIKHEPR